MATSDTSLVLRVPARICVNPFYTAFPTPPSPAMTAHAGSSVVTPGVHTFATSWLFDRGDGSTVYESALSTGVAFTSPSGTASVSCLISPSPTLPQGASALNVYATTAGGSIFYLIGSDPATLSLSDAALLASAPFTLYPQGVPTTAVFPFGGTELGLVRSATFRSHQVSIAISEECYGEEKVDLLDVGQDWTFECELRGLDPNAVATVFQSFATGPVSGRTDVVYPGSTFRAGTLRSASAVKLLVVPLDTNRHPCWYLPNALPIVASDEDEELQADKELVVKAIFQGTRDATGRVFLRRRLEDLTL